MPLRDSLQANHRVLTNAQRQQGRVLPSVQEGVQHLADLCESRAVLRSGCPTGQHYVISACDRRGGFVSIGDFWCHTHMYLNHKHIVYMHDIVIAI